MNHKTIKKKLYLLIFGDLSPDKQSSCTSYFVKSPQCVFEGKIKITIMQTFSHSLKDAGVNQGSNKVVYPVALWEINVVSRSFGALTIQEQKVRDAFAKQVQSLL